MSSVSVDTVLENVGNFFGAPVKLPVVQKWDWNQLLRPDEFNWQVGITPFTELSIVFGGMVSYLVVIFVLQVCCKMHSLIQDAR